MEHPAADDYTLIRERMRELGLDTWSPTAAPKSTATVQTGPTGATGAPLGSRVTQTGWCEYCTQNNQACDGACESGGW